MLRVPLEDVQWAIEKLSQPDPESRTKDEEGRRLVPIDSRRDWGWRLVTFEKYRNIGREQMRREWHRDYMANRRAAKGQGRDPNQPPPVRGVRRDDPTLFTRPPEDEAPPLRVQAQRVWDTLVGIKQFNLKPTDMLRQSGEVQHLVGVVHATEEELTALAKFYALPAESRYVEAKTRKLTPRGLLTQWGEQIALAMKVCGPKKKAAPSPSPAENKNGEHQEEERFTDEQAATVVNLVKDLREKMKATPPEPPADKPMGRHARRRAEELAARSARGAQQDQEDAAAAGGA